MPRKAAIPYEYRILPGWKALRPARIEVDGDTARIFLNGGGVAVIDAADAELVSGLPWRSHAVKMGTAAKVACHARVSDGTVRILYLHRLILNPRPDLTVDHIDGDGTNNRRSNLRECTLAENLRNRPAYKSRRFKGVSQRSRRLWAASIQVNGQVYRSSGFTSPEAAAAEYDRLALLLHGEYARLNAG